MMCIGVKCVTVFISFILATCVCQELSSTCEADHGNVLLTCVSEPQILLRTENVSVTIEPENMTCGTPPSYFRPLGYESENVKCDNSVPEKRHPPEFMIDDDAFGTWWQSITWPADMVHSDAPEVTVRLTFGKLYELTGDLKITFNSRRPKQMTIEKSRDNGLTWQIWQVYAETDCTGYPTTLAKEEPSRVICTREYSQMLPASGGTVLFKADDRYMLFLGDDFSNYSAFYDALDNTDLQQFLIFSDIRIKLFYPATDGREGLGNEHDYIRYYYAISDIEVVARCFCNQHASVCYDGPDGTNVCQCKHNTDGNNCEKCMPLYNNRPWKRGRYQPSPTGTANECTQCECNDHADSCTYSSMYGLGICDDCHHNTTGQNCEHCAAGFIRNVSVELNSPDICIECECNDHADSCTFSNVYGLGICDDCQHNTTGQNCEHCAAGFIRNVSVEINSPDVCPECECNDHADSCKYSNMYGLGICDDCQHNTTGQNCEHCAAGFIRNLSVEINSPDVCPVCQCERYGTLSNYNNCDQVDGHCLCKATTTGRSCERCKEGYYNFPTERLDDECLYCACNAGGSQTPACNEVDGSCICRPHVIGKKCTDVDAGYYVPAIDESAFQPTTGSSQCRISSDRLIDENRLDGDAIATCRTPAQVAFEDVTLGPQKSVIWPYFIGVRFTLNSSSLNKANGTLSITVVEHINSNSTTAEGLTNTSFNASCPETAAAALNISGVLTSGVGAFVLFGDNAVPLDMRCTYSLSLDISGSVTSVVIDSVVILPDLHGLSENNSSFQLFSRSDDPTTVIEDYKNCFIKPTSRSTQKIFRDELSCGSMAFAISAELYNGAIPCDCDPVGTISGGTLICETAGGQCPCKNGVDGRRCDRCIPGYYLFSDAGCIVCPVSPCSEVIKATTIAPSPTAGLFQSNYTPLAIGLTVAGAIIVLCIVLTFSSQRGRECLSMRWHQIRITWREWRRRNQRTDDTCGHFRIHNRQNPVVSRESFSRVYVDQENKNDISNISGPLLSLLPNVLIICENDTESRNNRNNTLLEERNSSVHNVSSNNNVLDLSLKDSGIESSVHADYTLPDLLKTDSDQRRPSESSESNIGCNYNAPNDNENLIKNKNKSKTKLRFRDDFAVAKPVRKKKPGEPIRENFQTNQGFPLLNMGYSAGLPEDRVAQSVGSTVDSQDLDEINGSLV